MARRRVSITIGESDPFGIAIRSGACPEVPERGGADLEGDPPGLVFSKEQDRNP
jgi:hypothetical protein